MALAQIYTAVAGHIITAARWNNEFGNIYGNGTDLAFPLTKAVSYAGYTVTYDAAGVSTITSTTSTGFLFTIGAKTGTPGANGGAWSVAAFTYTDTNTAGSGVAALWTGVSIRTPTLAATNTLVTTTNAASLYVEAGPTAGTNETITNSWAIQTGGNVLVTGTARINGSTIADVEDARTATVVTPLIVRATTTNSPAASIGTGILIQAESADENPSNVGQLECAFSDISAGTEDSYFQVLLRVAGAALTSTYRFAATAAFNAIFTHANTAARTLTLQNRDGIVAYTPTIEYLTSGTEWVVPTGVTRTKATIFGASGGGGGGGEGEGTATTETVGDPGTAGGTTSFNAGALSTTGGGAGFGGSTNADSVGANGAAHGVGTGGTVNRTGGGQSGGNGGEGGTPEVGSDEAGQNGGRGGDGGYVQSVLTTTPGATVTYAIGAAGAAGAGGTGGDGPDGGAGIAGQAGVIVLEY
jgi:hypothetical protein